MPEPKTYGYARDMEDISDFDSSNVPTEVTDNAIKFWSKDDHFKEDDEPVGEGVKTSEIKVHDMSVYSFYNSETREGIDEAYHDFDFALRDAAAAPSKEDPDTQLVDPGVDPLHPDVS